MPKQYRVTGINLKGMPLGENDRLLTILTREQGLLRVVAAGARKHRSAMAGRSGLFVVNDLQITVGRNMDRIKNAEMLQSFVGLGKTLAKLTAAQYLSELALMQALPAQPQEELFLLLLEHLYRIQDAENDHVIAHLTHGIYHLLAIAGFAPQVHSCCLSQSPVIAKAEIPKWRSGFSIIGGGVIDLESLLQAEQTGQTEDGDRSISSDPADTVHTRISHYLKATELIALQALAQTDLTPHILKTGLADWLTVERLLRAYAQYHFDRPIQSSALIDNCFSNI
jgi:DNA repair protein RecO (recombination protein O)